MVQTKAQGGRNITTSSVMVWACIDRNLCWNRKRRLLFIVHRPRKTNFCVPFLFFVHIYMLKRQHIYIYIYIHIYIYKYLYLYIHTSICCCFRRKTKTQVIFLFPFTVCSLCKGKFVVCSCVFQEINKSYPFANELNGLNRVANLWTLRHPLNTCDGILCSLFKCVGSVHNVQ
jgi:hypothetical protein